MPLENNTSPEQDSLLCPHKFSRCHAIEIQAAWFGARVPCETVIAGLFILVGEGFYEFAEQVEDLQPDVCVLGDAEGN